MKTAIIQFTCGIIGTGHDLYHAVENANMNMDSENQINYDDIELIDNVKSPVAGGIYWTETSSIIDDHDI